MSIRKTDYKELKKRILLGGSNKEIAEACNVSTATVCNYRRQYLYLLVRIKITNRGCHGVAIPASDFIKPEFLRTVRYFRKDDRTTILRFFYSIFKDNLVNNIDQSMIKRIRSFLNSFKLTRAEVNAIILHLGYKYANCSHFRQNNANLVINGYFDGRKKGEK